MGPTLNVRSGGVVRSKWGCPAVQFRSMSADLPPHFSLEVKSVLARPRQVNVCCVGNLQPNTCTVVRIRNFTPKVMAQDFPLMTKVNFKLLGTTCPTFPDWVAYEQRRFSPFR